MRTLNGALLDAGFRLDVFPALRLDLGRRGRRVSHRS
jgi:hypothetical protein